jgi:hypothetical protein
VSVPGGWPPSRLRARAAELRGRRRECEVLDRLIEAVRAGGSRALVVRGEPGVGRTALLDYLVGHASGCRVGRAVEVQSEMELAFAGLHQLCAPMLDRLDRLPANQAGRSRRYGGRHFRDGDLAGRALGRMVGLRAWLAARARVRLPGRAWSGVAA